MHKAQQKDASAGMDEDAFIALVGSHPERFEAILSLREQLQNIFIGERLESGVWCLVSGVWCLVSGV
jgi:hypothetical protein